MGCWRLYRRKWEIDLVRKEWKRGNRAFFPPDTTEDKVLSAVEILQAQIQVKLGGGCTTPTRPNINVMIGHPFGKLKTSRGLF